MQDYNKLILGNKLGWLKFELKHAWQHSEVQSVWFAQKRFTDFGKAYGLKFVFKAMKRQYIGIYFLMKAIFLVNFG